MRGYKGFNKDLKCRGMQYEVGKTYEAPRATLCQEGLHFCEHPLDCFGYYPPGDGSRYCEIEAPDDQVTDREEGGDTKRATTTLTIVRELTLDEMVEAAVKMTAKKKTSTGYMAASTSTGNRAASTSTGDRAASTSTGDRAASTSTGYGAASTSTGYMAASTSTGGRAASTSTGDSAASTASGKGSIAIASGRHGKARAAIGSAICLVERDADWHIIAVKAAIVDGDTLKADTWYSLKGGEFVEVGND